MDLYLAVLSGVPNELAAPLPVGKRLVLGRAINADLVLESIYVGRRICDVVRDEGGVWVTDRASRNGTFLNGRRLLAEELTPLRPGDDLRLANVRASLVRVDPAWSAWNDGTVTKMARVIQDERSFDRLPLLADALEDSGCVDGTILHHCRRGGKHGESCWVVEMLTVDS